MTSVSTWDNEYARLARSASQLRTTGMQVDASEVRSLQAGLQTLEADLSRLPLQPAEIQRRRRLVQHLQQTAATPQPQQQSVLASALNRQDEMIDQLASGVSRLKTQTMAIGEEASMHVNLINDMDTGLDAAQAGLQEETRRAAVLREDNQSIWKLQLVVAGLSVLLVLLIFLGLSP